MAGDLAPVYAPVGGGAAVGVLATCFAEVAAAARSSIAASVSMACTVAAIHSTCSTADRNKSHETSFKCSRTTDLAEQSRMDGGNRASSCTTIPSANVSTFSGQILLAREGQAVVDCGGHAHLHGCRNPFNSLRKQTHEMS